MANSPDKLDGLAHLRLRRFDFAVGDLTSRRVRLFVSATWHVATASIRPIIERAINGMQSDVQRVA